MSKYYIYVLKHPISKKIFYVGATINPQKRKSTHLGPTQKTKMGESIIKDGLKPIFEIIDTCEDLITANVKEKYWIKKMRQDGNPIENIYIGNYGLQGRNPADDPKVCIRLYIHTSIVEANGGEEELKEYLYIRSKKRGAHLKNTSSKKP